MAKKKINKIQQALLLTSSIVMSIVLIGFLSFAIKENMVVNSPELFVVEAGSTGEFDAQLECKSMCISELSEIKKYKKKRYMDQIISGELAEYKACVNACKKVVSNFEEISE